MPLPWGGFTGALAIIFGAVGAYSWFDPEDEPTVRMVIPLYVVAVYWVLAALFNVHSFVITSRRIWDIVWPVPVRFPRWTKRSNVRHCYLRNTVICEEGTELENDYTAGVETIAGRQIDVSGPHKTSDEAIQVAMETASILNQEPGGRMIEVCHVVLSPTRTQIIRTVLVVLFWLVLCIAAILVGAVWEEEHRLRRIADPFCCRPKSLALSSAPSFGSRFQSGFERLSSKGGSRC